MLQFPRAIALQGGVSGPGPWMMSYRLFFFDGGGHIQKAHEFVADDDTAAIKIAVAWREGRRMELWQRDRRVKVWS
jgi:hypothetical protein